MNEPTKKNPLPIPAPVPLEYFRRCCEKWIDGAYVNAYGLDPEIDFTVRYCPDEASIHCYIELTPEYYSIKLGMHAPTRGMLLANIESGPLGFQVLSCYAPPGPRTEVDEMLESMLPEQEDDSGALPAGA